MADAAENKLDHRLRALLARARDDTSLLDQEIHVFVRFVGRVEELAEAGARVGSVAGDIATAALRVRELPAFSGSPAVRLVEAAGRLGPNA
ncbi:MAG TPA: hypothetical protein VGO40_21120 [Longimicrobium sp.]|jgi:hypothetical protein|nr:hypothetical protein [Longimicrobium sp.]